MISFIRGNLFSLDGENLIVDVGGIGYRILVAPVLLKGEIRTGEEIFLYTYLQVREDSWQLFGFPEKEQLEIFRQLISVSGIGARLGLAVLNNLSVREIIQTVLAGDCTRLSGVPGIGKKIAQRMVLELKEKFKKLGYEVADGGLPETESVSSDSDVIQGLLQLGYSAAEARTALLKVSQILGKDAGTEDLIKGALKLLAKF